MAKLDKTKPFGMVHGVASHMYEQDGKKFDNEFNEVAGDGPAEQQMGSKVDLMPEKTYTQAQVDTIIAEEVKKQIAKIQPDPIEADIESDSDLGTGAGPPLEMMSSEPTDNLTSDEGPQFDIDRMNDITDRDEILKTLENIKEQYLPDLEYNPKSNTNTLRKSLRDAISQLTEDE